MKKKPTNPEVGQKVTVRGIAGIVTRLNQNGTCSIKLDEPEGGASFLHQVQPKDLKSA